MWIIVGENKAVNLDHVREACWNDNELLLYFNDSVVRRFDGVTGWMIWQEIKRYASTVMIGRINNEQTKEPRND